MLSVLSWNEIKQHNSVDNCWIVLHGKVYDVTKFLPEHPGGVEVVSNLGGQDATDEFEEIGHSIQSRKQALEYEVGVLEGNELTAKGAFGQKGPNSRISMVTNQFNLVPIILTCVFAFVAYFFIQWSFSH